MHLYGNNKATILERTATNAYQVLQWKTAGSSKFSIGLRETGDDSFHIYNYGTTADSVTIKTDGNVGIGTTTPVAKLSLQGTAGANDLFDLASSTGTSVVRVSSQGNVGIGTTGPGQSTC